MSPHPSHEERSRIRQTVRDHAAAQHGIFRRADLDALRVDETHIRTFLRRGWWVRLHHGVYIDADVLDAAQAPADRSRVLVAAALRAVPGAAYAYGPVAAGLHGLAVDRELMGAASIVRPPTVDQRALQRRLSRGTHLSAVAVHCHAIPHERTTMVDSMATIDRWDAAITTAACTSDMWALVTLDSAVWQDETGLATLTERVNDWTGLRGIGSVNRAMPLVRTGAQTALESISRFQLLHANVPEPRLQFPVHDRNGLIGYCDMAWPELSVIGEADGLRKYSDRSVLVDEKAREDRLRAQGWIVVRWTWAEILSTPQAVVDRFWQAVRTAQGRSANKPSGRDGHFGALGA